MTNQSDGSCKSIWVDSVSGVQAMVADLESGDLVAVDTEFIRETTFFPKVALLQIASDNKSWLVDPVRLKRDDLAPLGRVLQNQKILKIMHAALGDQECFYHEYGYVVSPVLDTAQAAALLGHGDSVGLAKLLKVVMGINLPKGRARVHWLERPLAPELLKYAEEDVIHLVELARRLLIDLDLVGRRDWAMKASQHSEDTFKESADSVAARVSKGSSLDARAMGCLYELVVWREQKARTLNRPRGWIADNSVLMSLARSRPKSIAELSRFRGINAKEIERSGEQILQAIERGTHRKMEGNESAVEPPSQNEELVMNLFKAFLHVLAANHKMAVRLLVGSDQMLPLIRAAGEGIDSWVRRKFLADDVAKIIGKEVESFLTGGCALRIEHGKLIIVP